MNTNKKRYLYSFLIGNRRVQALTKQDADEIFKQVVDENKITAEDLEDPHSENVTPEMFRDKTMEFYADKLEGIAVENTIRIVYESEKTHRELEKEMKEDEDVTDTYIESNQTQDENKDENNPKENTEADGENNQTQDEGEETKEEHNPDNFG